MDESSPSGASVPGSKGGSRPENPTEAVWKDCVRRISAGDESALSLLYDQSSALVFSVAQRILGSRADADEVTLDVFSQVWRSAQSYSPERGSVLAWLVLLARSRALDRLRAQLARGRREEAQAEFPEAASPERTAEQAVVEAQTQMVVRAALASLPPEQKAAVELAFFSGLTHAEVAVQLNQPLGTVKTRIRLGMMKLRELLAVSLGGNDG